MNEPGTSPRRRKARQRRDSEGGPQGRSRNRAPGAAGGFGGAEEPAEPAEPAEPTDPVSLARAIALRQLTMGPRTRAQLASAMARKGVPAEAAAQVLDRFEEVDLIDDQEFARQWVQSRHLGRGLAPRALAHELNQRGVEPELVREAVSAIDRDSELEAARMLIRRKWSSVRNDEPARRQRRLLGMLARKGYGAGVASQAIRDVTGEEALIDDESLG